MHARFGRKRKRADRGRGRRLAYTPPLPRHFKVKVSASPSAIYHHNPCCHSICRPPRNILHPYELAHTCSSLRGPLRVPLRVQVVPGARNRFEAFYRRTGSGSGRCLGAGVVFMRLEAHCRRCASSDSCARSASPGLRPRANSAISSWSQQTNLHCDTKGSMGSACPCPGARQLRSDLVMYGGKSFCSRAPLPL